MATGGVPSIDSSGAREDERPRFDRLIAAHLAVPLQALPVAEELWPAYELPNV